MLSRSDRSRKRAALPVLASAALLLLMHSATAAEGDAPTEETVTAAVEKLKEDPNLASERTTRILRWVDSDDPKPKKEPSSWLEWLADLMRWIADSSRLIVWLIVATLAALLVLFIVRFLRQIGPNAAARRFEAPTHVHDLDIRPESLPDDIGAEALALWQRGEHRAALSLLYRGLLSRLAHSHGLEIRHSTTENDCIDLATRHLAADSGAYVSQLVRMWQLAVYGGHEPATDDVHSVCSRFAQALAPSVSQETQVR